MLWAPATARPAPVNPKRLGAGVRLGSAYPPARRCRPNHPRRAPCRPAPLAAAVLGSPAARTSCSRHRVLAAARLRPDGQRDRRLRAGRSGTARPARGRSRPTRPLRLGVEWGDDLPVGGPRLSQRPSPQAPAFAAQPSMPATAAPTSAPRWSNAFLARPHIQSPALRHASIRIY